jgi:hypothetical protein
MGVFGKLDAAAIVTNPFFVKKGTYGAEVTAAKFQENKDGQKQLYIQYEITDEDSEYFGNKVNKIYSIVDSNMTAEDLAKLPPDEQKKIRNNLASLKRDLCGSDSNTSQKGLGVDIEDLDDENWDPAVLVSTKVVIGVVNYGANNEGVNIRWVNVSE